MKSNTSSSGVALGEMHVDRLGELLLDGEGLRVLAGHLVWRAPAPIAALPIARGSALSLEVPPPRATAVGDEVPSPAWARVEGGGTAPLLVLDPSAGLLPGGFASRRFVSTAPPSGGRLPSRRSDPSSARSVTATSSGMAEASRKFSTWVRRLPDDISSPGPRPRVRTAARDWRARAPRPSRRRRRGAVDVATAFSLVRNMVCRAPSVSARRARRSGR